MRPTSTLTAAEPGSPARPPAPGPSVPVPSVPAPPPVPAVIRSAATPGPDAPAIPAHALPHRTPAELLALARRGLAEAEQQRADGLRYATAHLAALRAAAAVLAARARPVPARRGRLTNVWVLLTMVAPELSEWAAFFAASAGKRAAAEAGIPRVVSQREADDLTRLAGSFVAVVELALGLTNPSLLDGLVA
jgi:hypothetical protein